MRDFYCERCYYWVFSIDETIMVGHVRVICRSCRLRQRRDLSKPSLTAEEARALRATGLRTNAA